MTQMTKKLQTALGVVTTELVVKSKAHSHFDLGQMRFNTLVRENLISLEVIEVFGKKCFILAEVKQVAAERQKAKNEKSEAVTTRLAQEDAEKAARKEVATAKAEAKEDAKTAAAEVRAAKKAALFEAKAQREAKAEAKAENAASAKADAVEAAKDAKTATKSLQDMSAVELRKMARGKNLAVSGSKAALISRIESTPDAASGPSTDDASTPKAITLEDLLGD